MPITKRYTLSELHSLMEDKGEFKARLGNNVERDNKRNNKQGVNDILKDTERASGRTEIKRTDEPENTNDYNKTTLDVRFDAEPSDSYKKRVQAQVEGFASDDNKKNSDGEKNGGSDYEGNKKFYKNEKDKITKRAKKEAEMRHAGLKARMMPKEDYVEPTMFGKNNVKESKTMKRLHFKNTRFLSEAQLINKIPEEYKTDGNRFYMRDNTGTDYLVECNVDREFNHTTINVINKINKRDINEQLHRMRSLSDYNSSDYFAGTNTESRKLEEGKVSEMLDLMKQMEKSVNK